MILRLISSARWVNSCACRNPVRNPIRGANGWMEQITAGDLMRIWKRHKFAAREMGYEIMNISGPFTPPPQKLPAIPRKQATVANDAAGSAPRQGAQGAVPLTC